MIWVGRAEPRRTSHVKRPSAVRTHEHRVHCIRAAVTARKQLRSELANETNHHRTRHSNFIVLSQRAVPVLIDSCPKRLCLTNVCPVVPGVHRVSGRGWWGWLLLCWPGPGISVVSWISTVSAMPLPPARFGGRAGKVVAEPGAAAPDGPARVGFSHDRLACRLEGR